MRNTVRAGSACPLFAALGLALTLLACEDKEKKQTPAETQQTSQEATASESQPSAEDKCPNAVTGNGTLTCGGKTYKTVKIGEQVWMAQNLNYAAEGSKCGGTVGSEVEVGDSGETDMAYYLEDENTANCDKYGRLYNWETAIKVCPSGWHLPSNAEWDKLFHYVDGTSGTESPYASETAGKYLKAKSGWENNGNGEDKFGFAALPGGEGVSGEFCFAGYSAYWLSSNSDDRVHGRFMNGRDERAAYYMSYGKSSFNSVRCIKD